LTPERWQKVCQVLDELLLLEPSRREQQLGRLRQEDQAVATEVASLLRQQDTPRVLDLDGAAARMWQAFHAQDELPPAAASAAQPLTQIGPYTLEAQVGKGGMGEVWRARDPQFRRSLAVKVLAEEHRANVDLRRRFLEEAQLMGQLQHPGIPPVHDLGELPDGRPYFAMKLIKGKTLAALLQERASPDQDHPRLLAIFEHICQTLAYAHAQGIVHRDLKPANVMVGAFGEVQVMDWGLAKVVGGGGEKAEAAAGQLSTICMVRTENPQAVTQAGQAMGTPAYMAPEQARGEVEQLDERCDVFGLGAILCEILTGQPPFAGSNTKEILGQAQQGMTAPAFARLDQCGVDRELVQLAQHCLDAHKADRPAHAGAVAKAITDYIARVQERLRQAELDRKAAEVRAVEERKRRRLHLALAASGLVLVCLTSAGVWWAQEQLAEQERQQLLRGEEKKRQEEQAQLAVQQTRHEQELLRREQKKREEERTQLAVQSALEQVKALEAKALWRQADKTLQQTLEMLGPSGDEQLRDRVNAALQNLALLERLDRIRQEKALVLEGKLNLAAAPPAYAATFKKYGFDIQGEEEAALVQRVAASEVGAELVAALDDWAVEEPDAALRSRLWQLTAKITGLAWRTELVTALSNREQLEQLLASVPAQEMTPALLAGLGRKLQRLGGDGPAVLEAAWLRHPTDFWVWFELGAAWGGKGTEYARQAADAYGACLAIRPESVVAWNNLGIALQKKGDLAGAVAAYQKAIRLDPKFAHPHHGLGNVLRDKKDVAGAVAAYQEAIHLDPKLAGPHNGLGNALHDQGNLAGAVAAYREAIRLDSKFAMPHYNLGRMLQDKGDLTGAVVAYKEAIRLDPKYANAHNNLGNVLRAKGDLAGAVAAYKEAIRLDPKDANAHYNLGVALGDQGDVDRAIAAYQEAIRLNPKLAYAHNNLGNALAAKGDVDGAISAYHEAIRLNPKDAYTHNNLGVALTAKGDAAGAISAYKQAVRINPKYANAHFNLGNALGARGDVDGAVAAYQEAIRLNPKHVNAHNNLGGTLHAKGDVDGAIAAYRETIRLDPKYVDALNNLGVALYDKGDMDGAIAAYKEAIRLRPKYAYPHFGLGKALQHKGELDGAIAAYKEAIRFGPKLLLAHYNLGRALQDKEDLDGAIAAYKKALALQPNYANGHAYLALALSRQQKYLESCRSYQAAFSANPQLGGDLKAEHRNQAARVAILAVAAQGKDAASLTPDEKAKLRQQALDWLKADLAERGKLLEADPKTARLLRKTLESYQKHPDLASVRDEKELAQLPEAERQAWRQFWAEVDRVLKRTEK
jgi:tetratricopeptide (TPR) repeat protein